MGVRSLAWSYDNSVRTPSLHNPRRGSADLVDCQLLLSASEDTHLGLHDVRVSSGSGKPGSGVVATFAGHKSWVLSADLSADGRLGLSGYVSKFLLVPLSAFVCYFAYAVLRICLHFSWRYGTSLFTRSNCSIVSTFSSWFVIIDLRTQLRSSPAAILAPSIHSLSCLSLSPI